MKLSKKKIRNLEKAIELATQPGACKYVLDGEPCCVIGRLAAIEGVPVSALKRWDLQSQPSVADMAIRGRSKHFKELIAKYPLSLLSLLQCEWDGSCDADPGIKDRMRQEVYKASA